MPSAEKVAELYQKKKNLEYETALLEHKRESERETLGVAGVKNVSNEIDSKLREKELVESEIGKREATLNREERSRLEMLLAPIYKEHRDRMVGIGRDKH
jgi:hypothetical protein